MKRTIGVLVAGALAMGLMVAPASAAAKAKLWVLHGVPGAKVDVCVNGSEVKSNFTYKQKFSADLPAGTYKVRVRAASAGECMGDVILKANPELKAGKNYTAVAGLDAAGSPELFLYKNDVSRTDGKNARVSVRHTAAAPKVDVWVNGSKLLKGLPNGGSRTLQVPANAYTVKVAPKGTTTVVIGPRTFDVKANNAYQIYATGNGDAGYIFQVLAQPVK
jgi:hypothetical protein